MFGLPTGTSLSHPRAYKRYDLRSPDEWHRERPPFIPETSWDTHGAVSEAGNELTRPVDDSGARTLSSLVALVLAWRNYAVEHGPLAFAMVASSPCDYTP